MGRKSALAGLWWGGGKGIIARQPGNRWRDSGYRRSVYADFGRFVSSLGGCYVTAEDAGTTPVDMAEIYRHTRFVTCIPRELGGSGNPSDMTAGGVVCAMEAALDALEMGSLSGKRIAMQGAGNVGTAMISRLLDAGVESIVVTELSEGRRLDLQDQFAGRPVGVRLVTPDDVAILAEPCDILAPNALGGVLGPKTIPSIQARIVCGAANNQLLDEERDAALLLERGITYVPDCVANRMGIVACSNEHTGGFSGDPQVFLHLERGADGSIYQHTRHILADARAAGVSPVVVANGLADELSREPHPIWGHRAWSIIEALTSSGWDKASASPN
jgi:glutamate dehydrogenase/leucine dehydrogenase